MSAPDVETTSTQLQGLLVELTVLSLTGKQAHWNVTGPRFLAVHQQLDTLVDAARLAADEVAERLVTLGVAADARVETLAAHAPFSAFPAGAIADDKAVALIVEELDTVIGASRTRIDVLGGADPVSQDLVTGIVGALEKQRWMFATQLR